MLRIRRYLMLAWWIVPCGVAAAEAPSDAHAKEAAVLSSMAKTNTWGHPDLFFEFAGMQSYADGHYQRAIDDFKHAARFADKVSQLSIGLMYLQGQGVDKDPVTAYAWLSLAAERGYPQFVATRDAVAGQLSAEQRVKADEILKVLLPEYGDAVAKPRLALEMKQTMLEESPVGKAPATVYTSTGATASDLGYCSSPEQHDVKNCGFYADWRWNPKQYFAARDELWQASNKPTVTVMPLQPMQPADSTPKPD